MLLVKQHKNGDFLRACLHILRSVVQPVAPQLTRDSAGMEVSRRAGPCILVGPLNTDRVAQVVRKITELGT